MMMYELLISSFSQINQNSSLSDADEISEIWEGNDQYHDTKATIRKQSNDVKNTVDESFPFEPVHASPLLVRAHHGSIFFPFVR
jgi:hypothetical protein